MTATRQICLAILTLACTLVALAGCGGAAPSMKSALPATDYRESTPVMAASEAAPSPASEPGRMETALTSGSAPPSPSPARDARIAEAANAPKAPGATEIASDARGIQQMLVYTARVVMAVFEIDKSIAAVETSARSYGGFVAKRTDREITVRIPVARFSEAMKNLGTMGDLLHQDVQVEDVTEEVLDLELRLKNARQVRDRIAQLLADAKNVQDSLLVEKELARLSGEIEHIEGRLKFLRDRALYSTITVTFQPREVESIQHVPRLPFPWLDDLGLGRLLNLR